MGDYICNIKITIEPAATDKRRNKNEDIILQK